MDWEKWKIRLGIAGIFTAVLVVMVLAIHAIEEDKVIERDGCLYRKTKEYVGDGKFDVEYTMITCDSAEFYNYTIED